VDCTTEGTICIEAGVQIYPTLTLYKDGWRQDVYARRRTALHLKQYMWDRLAGGEESSSQPNGVGLGFQNALKRKLAQNTLARINDTMENWERTVFTSKCSRIFADVHLHQNFCKTKNIIATVGTGTYPHLHSKIYLSTEK